MANETIAEGGTRILFGAVRIGDYIRFGGHNINPSLSDQWWKVTGLADDGTADDRRLHLVNAGGSTRTVAAYTWVKIFRHPYSQRHAA